MSPQHNNPSEPSVKQRSSLPAYLAAAVRYSCASQRRLVTANANAGLGSPHSESRG